MKKTMSLKQIAANQRNAQHSTGPKTVNGKTVSKMNALKHGILSTQVLVRGRHGKESTREFTALHRRFTEDLRPAARPHGRRDRQPPGRGVDRPLRTLPGPVNIGQLVVEDDLPGVGVELVDLATISEVRPHHVPLRILGKTRQGPNHLRTGLPRVQDDVLTDVE